TSTVRGSAVAHLNAGPPSDLLEQVRDALVVGHAQEHVADEKVEVVEGRIDEPVAGLVVAVAGQDVQGRLARVQGAQVQRGDPARSGSVELHAQALLGRDGDADLLAETQPQERTQGTVPIKDLHEGDERAQPRPQRRFEHLERAAVELEIHHADAVADAEGKGNPAADVTQLFRVDATGGEGVEVEQVEAAELAQVRPAVLPDRPQELNVAALDDKIATVLVAADVGLQNELPARVERVRPAVEDGGERPLQVRDVEGRPGL